MIIQVLTHSRLSPRKVLQILKSVAHTKPRPLAIEPGPQSAPRPSLVTNSSRDNTPDIPAPEPRDGSTVLIVDDNDLNVQVGAPFRYRYTLC